MTSKQQKKIQKKKAREQENRKKLLYRRGVATAKRQAEMAEFRAEVAANKAMRKEIRQQERFDAYAQDFAENLSKLPPDVRNKILHNMQVLKALEEEYEKEQAARKKSNEQLESSGHTTLSEKMKALHEELARQQGLMEHGQCQHAGCTCEEEHEHGLPEGVVTELVEPGVAPSKAKTSFMDQVNEVMGNLVTG